MLFKMSFITLLLLASLLNSSFALFGRNNEEKKADEAAAGVFDCITSCTCLVIISQHIFIIATVKRGLELARETGTLFRLNSIHLSNSNF